MKRPSLFVFDLDGTLIDSRTDLANAINAALLRLGLSPLPRKTVVSYVGDGIDALIRRCLTEEHLDVFERAREYFDDYYDANLLKNTSLLPEVLGTLKTLRKKSRLAVLTNKSEPYAKKILEGLGIASLFTVIVGEQRGKVPKSDPTELLAIMKRLSVSRDQTIMVGDGENDIKVSKMVGCKSCIVADSMEKEHRLIPFEPDFIIHKMGELPILFKEEQKSVQ